MATAVTTWAGMQLRHDPVVGGALHRDIVLPPSPTTTTLARLMVPRRCRCALDIGTGCGALALLAARLADDVFATDVNPRALAYGRANAEANGISNVTWLEGPLTDPVRQRRADPSDGEPMNFDLVVGNLPFVISPRASLTFRDGGDISAAAVAAAADILAPGGVAEFLVNWVVTDRGHSYDTPVSWLRSAGRGGLVLLHSLQTPEEYVATWAKHRDDDRDEWLAHLRDRGAVALANGAVVVHRPITPTPRPSIRAAPMGSPRGRGGDQVARMLRAASVSDAEIVGRAPRLVAATLLEEDAGDRGRVVRIRAHDSCGVTATVPVEQIHLLRRLDGTRRLDERDEPAVALVRRLALHGLIELDAP